MTEKELYKAAVENICGSMMDKALDFSGRRVKSNKMKKLTVVLIAAAAVALLCGMGVYTMRNLWQDTSFRDSADVLYENGKDYSAPLENFTVTCDNPDYEFEYVSAEAVGEFLFFGITARRTDGKPIYPADDKDELGISTGLYSTEDICTLTRADGSLADFAESNSGATGAADGGGIMLFNFVMADGGVNAGDHVRLEYQKLCIKRDDSIDGITEPFGENGYVPMNVTIEFDVAETPLKNRNVLEVNRVVNFESGNSYKINSISVSPFSVQVSAEEVSSPYVCAADFDDCTVIYKDGTEERVMGHTGSIPDCVMVIYGKFIDPEDIAALRIGDITIEM